jgi:transcriptional regulator with XRE-family HTH domain
MPTSSSRVPKTDTATAFGRLLRKYRTDLGMSQEALAAKAGYERAFISLMELGKSNPSLRTIFDLCAALEIKPSTMIRQVEGATWFHPLRQTSGKGQTKD